MSRFRNKCIYATFKINGSFVVIKSHYLKHVIYGLECPRKIILFHINDLYLCDHFNSGPKCFRATSIEILKFTGVFLITFHTN